MERFASAYGRALFPRRFGPGGRASTNVSDPGRAQPMGLAPGGIEIAMGAGIYRVVCTVEALVGGLRQLLAGWRWKPARRSVGAPVGCG